MRIVKRLKAGDAETRQKLTLCSDCVCKINKDIFRLRVSNELRHDVVSDTHRQIK